MTALGSLFVPFWRLALVLSFVLQSCGDHVNHAISSNDHDNYVYFAVKLDSTLHHNGVSEKGEVHLARRAEDISMKMGYHLLGPVGSLTDWFLFATPKPDEKVEGTVDLHKRHIETLSATEGVVNVRPQIPTRRLYRRDGVASQDFVGMEPKYQRRILSPPEDLFRRQSKDDLARWKALNISDPGFTNQWHLVNWVQPDNDLNVTGVWEQGITGKNVVVCFIDDGVDYEHPDLRDAFYFEGSYDYNDHVKTPMPRIVGEDRHGTRCAGEVAARPNDVCGVGVAYGSRVSGVRILSGDLTEVDEAASINYAFQENHIYSCSWGPSDNGQAMEAPPAIVADAFINGIVNGRGGLGSVFVFATGNGGANGDNCNFDGYTNSIYTITVGAVDRQNGHPPYSEECSAQMVVAYTSGAGSAIYTSDWPDQCTDRHGGTSAAAPLVSGIIALVLQIRPDLSWRDLQHICVDSAIPISLGDRSWFETFAGRPYSHKYGYGKLDAYRTVEFARNFVNVQPQTKIQSAVIKVNKDIPQTAGGKLEARDDSYVESLFTVTEAHLKSNNFKRLEHITVTLSIEHQRRGDVEVTLTSPHGIVSQLATRRPSDTSNKGFSNWTFMTVAHWDEDPLGEWKLRVSDVFDPESKGTFKTWWITLFGESNHQQSKPTTPPKQGTSTTKTPTRSTTLAVGEPTQSPETKQTPEVSSKPDAINSDGDTTPASDGTSVNTSTVVAVFFGVGALVTVGSILYIRRKRFAAAGASGRDKKSWGGLIGGHGANGGGQGYEFAVLNSEDEFDDGEGYEMRDSSQMGVRSTSPGRLQYHDEDEFDDIQDIEKGNETLGGGGRSQQRKDVLFESFSADVDEYGDDEGQELIEPKSRRS
ncbi:pheromone processing endoprotease Kex2 [Cladochytrium replicatum]|nr:pheromone processing endoprotease Kex2 [Cladochytrium replicatum]